MKFNTADEVKKWLRGLPLLKKELELKILFYKELVQGNRKIDAADSKYTGYYEKQIFNLQRELIRLTKQMEDILDVLDPEERMILTARYLRGVLWDAMEFHVHYSRRQAIRIHNQAVERLVGVELGGDDLVRDERRPEARVPGAGFGQTQGTLALR